MRRRASLRPPPPAVRRDLVLVGEFGRAQGLKGEVRLKSFTADPLAIAAYGPLSTEAGEAIVLNGVRAVPGGTADLLIARVAGIAGRTAAEALNRVRLFLDRGRLPPPAAEDEFLIADLVGLAVVDAGGTAIGTVVAVPNYGGGDLLEIAPAGGGATALLPFTRAFVPAVEVAAGRVVVSAPDDLFVSARPGPRERPDAP